MSTTLDKSFTIEIDGKCITKLRKNAETEEEIRWPVETSSSKEAAVFTLKDGYLCSEDLYMGRFFVEPPMFMPMQVFWLENRQHVRQCSFLDEPARIISDPGRMLTALCCELPSPKEELTLIRFPHWFIDQSGQLCPRSAGIHVW
jgi:hypothetical protein